MSLFRQIDLLHSLFFLNIMIVSSAELVISLWVFRGIYNGYVFSSYICVVSCVFNDIDMNIFIRMKSVSARYGFLAPKSVGH